VDNIVAVFKSKSVLKKIGFTLLAFLIYKLATYITVPLVDPRFITDFFETNDGGFIGMANALSGNALKQFSVIALGISPYITASIVVQLLQMDIIPVLKEWTEEGETGKQKINQLTRYLAIGLAFVQALAMTLAFEGDGGGSILIAGIEGTFLVYVYIAIVITAGTAFLLWLADQITLRGIGNGTSMLIVAGIVSSLPSMFYSLWSEKVSIETSTLTNKVEFGIVVLIYIAVIFFVTYMQSSQRKIPIQYSNRPASSKFQGRSESNIPIKINSAGVIPVIFAVTLLSIPQTISGLVTTEGSGAWRFFYETFTYTRPLGYAIYVALIFVFAFFYAFVQINPEKVAKNLQNQKAYVPGVRPGVETENHISRVLFRVTIVGALYLVAVASLPLIATMVFDLPSSVQIGGTSLLIVVGVAIETTKQIKTQTQEQTYSGFIK
jgi:preprotein translocase subunit SecY